MSENGHLARSYRRVLMEMRKRIEEGKSFNRYEYYKYGGVAFKIANEEIYKLLRSNLITRSEYEMLKAYIIKQRCTATTYDKDFILSSHYQFGETVLSDIEKKAIWKSLCEVMDENNIDDLVFSGAVREYAMEKGLIKPKKEVNKRKR